MTIPIERLGSIFADPAFHGDPVAWHAMAARVRAEAPLHRFEVDGFPPFWAVTRHADILEVERNPTIFINEPATMLMAGLDIETAEEPPVKTLVQMDGAQHRAHREVLNSWFKPGNVRKMQERIDGLATIYVDRMASTGGTCDFMSEVGLHYPLQVILSLLGLPESDFERMLKLTQELFGAEDPDLARIGEDSSQLNVLLDMVEYFTSVARERRDARTDDLASVIANALIDGAPMADLDMLGHFVIIATAGHDTTSSAISGGLVALLEHPDQFERLKQQPDLIDNAADEIIRWTSPVKHFMRTCREPYRVHGQTIQPNDLLLLSFPSANRDADVFPDADRLDVGRANAASHVGFGFGRHFCLGAHLARLEVRAVLRAIITRFDHIELAGEPTWIQSHLVSGPKTVPVTYQLR